MTAVAFFYTVFDPQRKPALPLDTVNKFVQSSVNTGSDSPQRRAR